MVSTRARRRTTMRVMTEYQRSTKAASSLALLLALAGDAKTGGFISFPIRAPDTDECLGRGSAHGCFIMRSSDVQVSNTGIIAGKTHIFSEDAINGFQGNVEVRLQDQYGNDLWLGHVGCWGVN